MDFEMGPSGEMVQKSYIGTMSGSSFPVSQTFIGGLFETFAGQWSRHITALPMENILAFSAVDACLTLISNDCSTLRPMLMKRAADGVWDEITNNSPFLPVLRKPNHYQTRIQFIQTWIVSKLVHGNAYIYIERDNRGIPTAFYPVDPRRVRVAVGPDGSVWYDLAATDGLDQVTEPIRVPASSIIHDRMKTTWHYLCGVSAIYACGSTATQGIRAQNSSETFFANMSRPSGHLAHPGNITKEQLTEIRQTFEEKFSGANVGRLLVTGGNMKYEPMNTIPAEDAQLIETLKWTVEDVARCFLVPLHKICAGPVPSVSNVGALNQQYYNDTLRPHIESIERLLTEALGLDPLGMEVWLDLEELLRMDPLLRSEMNAKAIGAGYLSPDEARLSENLHGVPGGDSPYMQQQNWRLGQLAERKFPEDAPSVSPPPIDDDGETKEMTAALTWLKEKCDARLPTIR